MLPTVIPVHEVSVTPFKVLLVVPGLAVAVTVPLKVFCTADMVPEDCERLIDRLMPCVPDSVPAVPCPELSAIASPPAPVIFNEPASAWMVPEFVTWLEFIWTLPVLDTPTPLFTCIVPVPEFTLTVRVPVLTLKELV